MLRFGYSDFLFCIQQKFWRIILNQHNTRRVWCCTQICAQIPLCHQIFFWNKCVFFNSMSEGKQCVKHHLLHITLGEQTTRGRNSALNNLFQRHVIQKAWLLSLLSHQNNKKSYCVKSYFKSCSGVISWSTLCGICHRHTFAPAAGLKLPQSSLVQLRSTGAGSPRDWWPVWISLKSGWPLWLLWVCQCKGIMRAHVCGVVPHLWKPSPCREMAY